MRRRLARNANCQTLVSLTLASGEVPVMVGLRLFLSESWTSDPARLARARRPSCLQDQPRGGKKNPQPSTAAKPPAIRQAILNALAQPPPTRCPHCRRRDTPRRAHVLTNLREPVLEEAWQDPFKLNLQKLYVCRQLSVISPRQSLRSGTD